jgi:hypothetical protein
MLHTKREKLGDTQTFRKQILVEHQQELGNTGKEEDQLLVHVYADKQEYSHSVQNGGVPIVSGYMDHTSVLTQMKRESKEMKGHTAVL